MTQDRVRLAQAGDPALSVFVDLTDLEARTLREPAEGIYVAEGLKVIRRALAAGHQPLVALTGQRWLSGMLELLPAETPIHQGDEALLKAITGYRVHRGALVAFVRPLDRGLHATLDDARTVVVLEDLKEHVNVGSIVRSAAAFGVDALVLSPQSADPLYRRALKVSMGTVFTLPWCRALNWPDDLEAMKERGFRVAALTPHAGATPLADFVASTTAPIAWVFGTEGLGLTQAAIERCTDLVRIPMRPGVDSLNVGAAAAVAFYASAQREVAADPGAPFA